MQERLRENIFSDFFIFHFYFLSFGISYKIDVFFSFSDNLGISGMFDPPTLMLYGESVAQGCKDDPRVGDARRSLCWVLTDLGMEHLHVWRGSLR